MPLDLLFVTIPEQLNRQASIKLETWICLRYFILFPRAPNMWLRGRYPDNIISVHKLSLESYSNSYSI